MPPQPTKLRPGTGRDSPALRLVVISTENTTDAAPAKARPEALPEALTGTRPEKKAGSAIAPARNVLRLLQQGWRAFWKWRQAARSRTSLHELSDRQLEDIGLTSFHLDRIVARRTLERLKDGAAYPWHSRGVM